MRYPIAVQRNHGLIPYGRSRKGNQCIQKLPLAKTPNTTVCMIISQNNLLIKQNTLISFFNAHDSSVKSELYFNSLGIESYLVLNEFRIETSSTM